MNQPSAYIVIDGEAIARNTTGEIVATDVWTVDQPNWDEGMICDHRGIGGDAGYALLDIALRAAEANALPIVGQIQRLGS